MTDLAVVASLLRVADSVVSSKVIRYSNAGVPDPSGLLAGPNDR